MSSVSVRLFFSYGNKSCMDLLNKGNFRSVSKSQSGRTGDADSKFLIGIVRLNYFKLVGNSFLDF